MKGERMYMTADVTVLHDIVTRSLSKAELLSPLKTFWQDILRKVN